MEIQISAPGKVILHGEHSVVYGKLAVAASLGLRTKLKLCSVETPSVFILEVLPMKFTQAFDLAKLKTLLLNTEISPDFNFLLPDQLNCDVFLKKSEEAVQEIFDNNMLTSSQNLTIKCIFFLFSAILHSVNVDVPSFTMTLDTELEMGSGGGSSASFLVTTAASLVQFIRRCTLENNTNLSKNGYQPCSWTNEELENQKQFSDRLLEVICKWAFYAEKIVHGTPSGIDNTVCTYGNMVKFRKNQSPDLLRLNHHFNILLINTHVSRQTKMLVSKVAKLRDTYPEIINNTLDSLDNLSLIAIKLISEIDKDPKRSNIDQYYTELNSLISMNHSLLRSLGVSHVKLDEIIVILERHGLAGKLTGAGGGGYVISVVPPDHEVQNVVNELQNYGFSALFTKLGGEGVTID